MTDQRLWRPDETLRVAVVGLLSSHPGSDVTELARLTGDISVTLTDETAAAASFLERFPSARAASLDEALEAAPHVVIVTLPSPEVPACVAAGLDAGAVVWVNKPASVHADDLAALDASVAKAPGRFLTASILRFAPGAPPPVDRESTLALRSTIRHSVAHWSDADSAQDARRTGGGLVGTMGLHGFELFSAVAGPGFRVVNVATSTRGLRGLLSEDTAVVTVQWPDGLIGTIEVLGDTVEDNYSLTVLGGGGDQTWTLPSGVDDPHGGVATMRAVLTMAQGSPAPVGWEESRSVLSALAKAVSLAESARPDGGRPRT